MIRFIYHLNFYANHLVRKWLLVVLTQPILGMHLEESSTLQTPLIRINLAALSVAWLIIESIINIYSQESFCFWMTRDRLIRHQSEPARQSMHFVKTIFSYRNDFSENESPMVMPRIICKVHGRRSSNQKRCSLLHLCQWSHLNRKVQEHLHFMHTLYKLI